ncbi:MAG TPA: ABC transporter ATP-binding protein [Acidimicrobiales bacterium]|nr:ABC transporter ATP-binding protein [Acidimicrobiales bacterium]
MTRRFGALTAVDGVSLEVWPGEVVGLLGANGAGKTTLIRMFLGLLSTSGGRVEVLGGTPDRERRRRLGYVPQNLGLYRDLTVSENLRFVAGSYGASIAPLGRGLARFGDVLVRDLPLGVQRQVSFLAALSHEPELLLMDEPTSGVDALSRVSLWDTIRDRSDRGVGVLVSTHYMQEARQCDRLLLMADGRLVAQGTEADIVGSMTAIEVHAHDWARAFSTLSAAGLPVMLAGRSVRVANADATQLEGILTAQGIAGRLEPVAATIEERMLMIARQPGGASASP